MDKELPTKISMAELQRLARDPEFPDAELRNFFTARPEISHPFSPAIIPNPRLVDVAEPEDEFEAAVMMNWANDFSRLRRQIKFRRREGNGDKRPVIVSEGDSWFQFPFLLVDVIDQLSDEFNVWSVGAAGDTLQNMVIDQPEYLEALVEHENVVRAFLFSGSGNDFLGVDSSGKSKLPEILKPYKEGKPAKWYIDTTSLKQRLQFVEDLYSQMLATIADRFPGLPVICHGYDYAIPGAVADDTRHPVYAAQDAWLGRPLRDDLGIVDPDLQRAITKLLIDRLNDRIASLCGGNGNGGAFKNAWHVDARGTLDAISLWSDELHPTNAGFAKVADKFREVIAAALPTLETTSYVCEASGESEPVLEVAAVKPHVNRQEETSHKSSRGGTKIDHIVVHYTTSRNINGTISHFKDGTPRVSAHYIVGRDGELVQMVADPLRAWHAGSSPMNARSIGIEHVAAAGDAITQKQSKTSVDLIRWLMHEYDIPIANVIPHVCVKPTSCCGDLFKEFGGGADKPCAVQKSALHKWLRTNGIGANTDADLQATVEERDVDDLRIAMAKQIVDFEARRDRFGHLIAYKLPAADGGGRYEVAGINERYHKNECDELVRLIDRKKYAEAERRAREFIAQFTDIAGRWCNNKAVEFYLRDCTFNRGPGGAARILQRALGVAVDGKVGPLTREAVTKAEVRPLVLLESLRNAREWYERVYVHRDEGSIFWKGLVNRWNKAQQVAVHFQNPNKEIEEVFETVTSVGAPISSQMRARMQLADDTTLETGDDIPFIESGPGKRPFDDIGDLSPVDNPEKMLNGWRAYRNGIQPEEDFEAIVERDTSLPASFLQLLSDHRRVVGRISAQGTNYRGQEGRWAGTGFLVSTNILLTNHHVLNSIEVASAASIDFEYEVLPSDLVAGEQEPSSPPGKHSHRFNPSRLFLTSPATGGGLDFTFVWVDIDSHSSLAPIPMRRSAFSVAKNEQAFVIHHPHGHGKRVSVDDVDVVDINTTVVRYVSDTMPGSSGSPVFDRQGRLFGLHHAGKRGDFRRPDGRIVGVLNEGIKIGAIVLDLERRRTTSEQTMAEAVLERVQGSDTMSGFFGNLGRARRIPTNATGVEAVVDAYRGSDADVDIGFWNIEWLANRYHDAEKLREAAALITDLGLDVWGLEEVSPQAVRALVEELDRNFREKYDYALSEPNAPEGKQSTAVIWKKKTMSGQREDWPEEIEPFWSLRSTDDFDGLEAVEGRIFNRYPGLFQFSTRRPCPFSFFVIPVHLKAMAEGSKRRRLASRLLARAIRLMTDKYGKNNDWVLGGDFNAELATNDFSELLRTDLTPLSAADEQAGSFSYIKSPNSLIDHIFLSPNLLRRTDGDDYFIVAKDKTVDNYAGKLSDHRPVLVRLSLNSASVHSERTTNVDTEIERLLADKG